MSENSIDPKSVKSKDETSSVNSSNGKKDTDLKQNKTNVVKNEKKSSNSKKKLPFILRFLRGLFIFLLVALLIIVVGLAYCTFDKKSTLSVMPRAFSAYVRTDSAFETIEPLIDLQATDVVLANPELKSIRPAVMMLRSSELRKVKVFQKILSRPVDAAIYEGIVESNKQNFLAVLNLGPLSCLSRPLKTIYPKIQNRLKLILEENKIELNLIESEVLSYFELKTEDTSIFFTPIKNIVIASDSSELLLMSVLASNEISYTETHKKLLSKKTNGLQIVVNARKFTDSVTKGNEILENIAKLLPEDELSTISLNISDSDIFVDVNIPVTTSAENPTSLDSLITKKSTIPSFMAKMNDIVQYYTILNLGTFEEMQKAVFPILPVKNSDSIWSKANMACKLAFSMDLEEMLFSWTGKELAVIGIENQNDPVFVIQVKDEKKRKAVFEKLISSIFVKDDNSLILGGVRLPKLKLPSFLNSLISLFGVNIPEPYFLAQDGFIYFSESPEALSAIFSNADSGKSLMKTDGWTAVSSKMKNEASVSLFYDLERSVPFFLRSNADLSKVLELYTMGRFDVKIKKNEINIALQANARKSGNLRTIPGFPLSVGKNAKVSSFVSDSAKNPSVVFWNEGNDICSLDLASLEVKRAENIGSCELVPASSKTKNGVLWALNAEGQVFLFDKNFDIVQNFPVLLTESVIQKSASYEDNLVISCENGSFILVDSIGATAKIEMPEISIKASPSILGDKMVVYNKSFLGEIYYVDLKELVCRNPSNPINVDSIGFGSPVLIKNGKNINNAFITQSGHFSIKDENGNSIVEKDVEGVFEGQIVASEKYIYALSTEAVLYRFDLNGEMLTVKIPNSTGKKSYLSVKTIGKSSKPNIYVNADSNIIYGFNENLELLSGFPLAGSGNPVFADINGDKLHELISMSIDKKLLAWKLR